MRIAPMLAAVAAAAVALTIAPVVATAEPLSDAQIRARIIERSLRDYPGNCPCPYNTDRAGRSCGKRSAWSRAGGLTPTCYPDEISDARVRDYRALARN
jgi:hypothetical protein